MAFLMEIPRDIIFDIFSKFPVKSLMRFKCVSKLYNSLIIDPHFVDFYHSHSIYCPDCRIKLFLRIWGRENFYTIDPKSRQIKASIISLEDLNGLNYTKFEYVKGLFCLWSSCYRKFEYVKGLFCLWSSCYRIAAICNPNTRETRFLPHLNVDTDLSYQCHYSLGFDSDKRRHKVLMTLYGIIKSTRQWVLTIGPGESWREIKTIPYNFHPLMQDGIYIDGVIYFFIGCSNSNGSDIKIAKFNVTTEETRTISLWCDEEYQGNIEGYFSLIEIKGKLAVIYSKYGINKLWILQSGDEWMQLLQDQVVPTNLSSPLCCTCTHDLDKKEIAIVHSSKSILLYDLKKKTWRQIDMEGLTYEDKIISIYSYDDNCIYSLGRI